MITLKNIRTGYGGHVALHGLDCRIAHDRTTVLLGPGGSGKSSFLKVLASAVRGPLPPMWCTGVIEGLTDSLFYLPQGPETAALSRPLRALLGDDDPPERTVGRVWDGIAQCDALLSLLDVPLAILSPSRRRLVTLTAALASRADLLLLDEPDAGADERDRAWIRACLAALRGRRTIVLVTHDLELARSVSDDALFLLDGRLIEAADTHTFFAAPVHPRTRDLITYGA